MSEDILSRAQHLSDLDLLARLKALAQREREATVALIAHLAVLDERRLYLAEVIHRCSPIARRISISPSTPPTIGSRRRAPDGSFL